jgi:hypothetical protein
MDAAGGGALMSNSVATEPAGTLPKPPLASPGCAANPDWASSAKAEPAVWRRLKTRRLGESSDSAAGIGAREESCPRARREGVSVPGKPACGAGAKLGARGSAPGPGGGARRGKPP